LETHTQATYEALKFRLIMLFVHKITGLTTN